MAERDLIDELLQAKVKSKLFGGDHAPRLGRLVILDRLGSGGMGTVLSAYDPQLDRKVAVKILRDPGDAGARVLSEARMLGKLNHPNVVAVHDVSELDGAIAIVMELATGEPLRAWIGQSKPVAEVTRVMREVAAGLAAAHAAGIVHRDVKPDNIVIGPDRARLVDFGLATAGGAGEAPGGTGGYLAPEVLAGAPTNAASDQYSFGVTLHEVLHGTRPEPGGSKARNADVPRWLEQVTERALSPDPSARFPSMAALAHELAHDRAQRRRLVVLSAAALSLTALAVTVGYQRGQHRDACAGGGARIAASWPPERVAELRTSLGDSPWARKATDDFVALTASWEKSYRRVCEASPRPERVLELRMRCLDRRLQRMDALGAQLAGPLDGEARESLSVAVASLPRPERCESLSDASELALPDDPSARRELEHAERELDRAWALYSLGRYADARGVSASLDASTHLAIPRFRAARLLLLGQSEARLGLSTGRGRLEAALLEASTANAAELELEIWTRLLKNELFDGKPAHVVEWAPFARATAARAGSGGAELDAIEGEARRDSGDFEAAKRLLARALATGDYLRGDQRALIEMNLGSIELANGSPERAGAAFARALELATAALGAEHPSLGLYYDKQAVAARERGRIAEALGLHERALELRRRVFGESDRAVATALLRRAETRIEAGKLADAEADLTSARQIRVRLYGGEHRRLGEIDLARGDAAAARGERARALTLYRSATGADPSLDVAARLAELGEPADPGRAESAWTTWAARGEAVSARLSNDVARIEGRLGHRENAALAHAAALAALTDEPCRQRLRALTGLALAADGPRANDAARSALVLLDAMPELGATTKPELQRVARR